MKHAINILVTTACLLLSPLTGYAGGNPMHQFNETVRVEPQRGRVLVKVVFDNPTDRKVFVPKAIATEKTLTNALFDIKEASSGEQIAYSGMMVKRGPITAHDYYAVKPHSTHRNTIDITDSYDFKQGSHAYQLSYQGSYLTDLSRLDQAFPLEPVRTSFTYAK